VAVLAAITSLLLLGVGCTDDRTATASAEQVATTCCLATLLTSENGHIEDAAVEAFGEDYAGLGTAGDGGPMVFTAGTIPEALPDALEGVPVGQVRYNLSELEAFKARLDAVAQDVIAQGVRLVSWGVDPGTNSISVGVASDLNAAARVLTDRVGPDVPISVHADTPVMT